MSVNSCSSCASSNLATQYAEQLAEKRLDRLRGIEPDPNKPGQTGVSAQSGGATVNGLGERVGALLDTSA
jgi:hypothetical protein